MSIVKLKSFKATADVLGLLREVEFDAGNLLIGGLSLEDAHAILKHCSIGSVAGADPLDKALADVKAPSHTNGVRHGYLPGVGSAVVVDGQALPRETKANGGIVATISGNTIYQGDTQPTPKLLSAAIQSSDDGPKIDDTSFPLPDEAPAKEKAAPVELKIAGEAPGEAAKSSPIEVVSAGVPEAIKGAKRLTVIVDYFVAQGVREADAIVKECEALKAQVPLLQRITNLSDRVKTALETSA